MQKLLEYAKSYSKSVKEMVTRCTNGGDITGNEVKSKNSNANVASLSLDFHTGGGSLCRLSYTDL